MPTQPYDDILKRARAELSAEERSRLAAQLIQPDVEGNGKKHDITQLRGLGKEVWHGIDPDAYVAEERDAWNG